MSERAGRRAGPTAGEVKAIAEILYRHWQPARKRLKRYVDGDAPWEGAGRAVRTILKEVFADPSKGVAIPVRKRLQLYDFVEKYGTQVRANAAEETRTDRQTIRLAPSELDLVTEAAKAAGVPVANYIRDAALLAAQEAKKITA